MKLIRALLALAAVAFIFVVGFGYGRWYSTRPTAPAGRKILSELGVTLHSLATWWDVLAVAKASGQFDPAKLAQVEAFMRDPAAWSKAHGGVAAAAAE